MPTARIAHNEVDVDASLCMTSGSLDGESRLGGTLTVAGDRHHPSPRSRREAVLVRGPLKQPDTIQKNIAQ